MATDDIQEELEDLSNTMFGDDLKSCSSVSPLDDELLADPDMCAICGNNLQVPRVLACLHVFCEECLENKLIGEAGDANSSDTVLTCPTCKQETKVGNKKVACLPLDIINTNVMDASNMSNLTCTCCTTKEMAISRCCTCLNMLCANCNSAHQYMRCFENHRVTMLEELKVSGGKIPIHKTLMCESHASEVLGQYCMPCQQLVCGECVKGEHRSALHQCEPVSELETRVKQELELLVEEGRAKVDLLLQASTDLDASLGELAHQRSTARDLINESYQSYKAVLERCRDDALSHLNLLYHERELKVMDMSHRVGKDINLVEDACKFTTRLLENGNSAEIMYLKKFVGAQLLNLINNTPKPDKKYSIEFDTDFEKFERTLKSIFGQFTTESTSKRSSPALSVVQNAPLNGVRGTLNGCPSSLTNSSPISMTASMQSSFDGDMQTSTSIPAFPGLAHNVLTPDSPPVAVNFTSIAEYNIQQLASLAEKVDLTDSVVSMSHAGAASSVTAVASSTSSPTPSFTLADLFAGDINSAATAYQNLHALAKLGLNTSDVANSSLVLARGASPGIEVAALSLSSPILNGFGPMSNSTSPILSTPEDMLPDSLHPGNAGGPQGGSQGGGQAGALVPRTAKVSPMQIRCKFGQLGPSKGQFNSPHGFCLGLEEDIIVADTNNHRIQVFEKTGTYKFQFGIPGKDEGQLWYPRKVAVMRQSGKYVVCDRGNERSRMQIFTKNGHFIKKIAIRYIDIVAGLAVTASGEIVAVDSVSPTVFVISDNGELLRWFDCSDFMREPSDIAIHGEEYYVCDFKGHNVVVFTYQGVFLRRIGCENITNFPNGIDISDAGDILIGDSHGNRFHVAVFARDGSLVTEFECPYVKVSRCCGLKITSEGYIVTLAKNNHHVLVLNTLYIL